MKLNCTPLQNCYLSHPVHGLAIGSSTQDKNKAYNYDENKAVSYEYVHEHEHEDGS